MTWLEAFIWTCAIETPCYVWLLRRSFRSWWAPVLLSVVLQLTTHPLLWRLFQGRGDYATAFLVLEAGAALTEGALLFLLLRRRGDRRPLLHGMRAALLANAFSAAAGLLFYSGSG